MGKMSCERDQEGVSGVADNTLGERNGNPLQCSCLENPMDREEPGRLQSMGSQRVGHS